MKPPIIFLIILMYAGIFGVDLKAEYTFDVGAELNMGTGSGDFAPFYLHSNRHGKLTQAHNFQLDLWAIDTLDMKKKFDIGWGLEAVGGYANRVDYMQWNNSTGWQKNPQGPAPVWVQQMYGELKWRCLFLSLGLKRHDSCFVDQRLSSGDLLWSGNSRGIPEARIGFVDFQDIPFTNRWVQFDVSLSYGIFTDEDWVKNHFDYYRGRMNPDPYWSYKRLAARTNPSKPFMFQAEVQMSTIFGGTTYYYGNGRLIDKVNNYTGFKDFIQVLLPFWTSQKEGYRVGDTKGTWDFAARYNFKGGESVRAYVQWPWEDSSGIVKKNGFDGLWGAEFKLGRPWWITGAVVEYLDLTHMSGPILYDPAHDDRNPPLPGFAGGLDAYYNNYFYRAYTNYGMNMGTPMVQGVIFQKEKNSPEYVENGTMPYFRVRGIHLALEGNLTADWTYMVKYNHRKAWGSTNTYALIHPVQSDSFMASVSYQPQRLKGLAFSGSLALDHGNMPGNAFGVLLGVSYWLKARGK